MKTGLPENIDSRPELMNTRFRSQFSVFLVFVFSAGIIWLFIKLSKDFTSTITYKIDYQNIPVGQILMHASDSTITVGLDARGYDLVSYHLWKKKTRVSIDLSGVKLQGNGNSFSGFLLTSGLTRKLAQQVGSHNELLFINPDTLKFQFMPEHSRRVPVNPLVQYQLRSQFMLYDNIKVYPDSIWIYGPYEVVDTIFSVNTVQKTFTDLYKDKNEKIRLEKPLNIPLTYSAEEVEISLKVEKFTEKAFELPIKVVCPGSDFTLRIFPETVTVHCLVALKDYRRVDPGMFEAVVNCRPGDMSASSKLRIELTAFPSYIRLSRIEPERVEYILVKPTQ